MAEEQTAERRKAQNTVCRKVRRQKHTKKDGYCE